jgi:hypothetical protein
MWRCSNVSSRAGPFVRIPAALAGQSSIDSEAVNRVWRCSNVSTRAGPSARIPAALAGHSSIVSEAVNRGKCGAAVMSVRGLDRLRESRLHWQVSPV